MAALNGYRYFVGHRDLRVGLDGRTVVLGRGEEIPNPEEWGRSLDSNLQAGRIFAVPASMSPEGTIRPAGPGGLSDEQLLAELDETIPTVDELLALTRDELDQKATELRVESTGDLPNKRAVADAILAALTAPPAEG